MLPALLGPNFGVVRPCSAGRFCFEDQELAPTGTELRFVARIVDATGNASFLPAGDYLTYVNPFLPDTLYVCGLDGSYLGACDRENTPRRDDEESLKRSWGMARKMESELAAEHAKPGRAMWREADRARANVDLLTGKPTRAERAETKRQREDAQKISELLHGGLSLRRAAAQPAANPEATARDVAPTPAPEPARGEDATPAPLW